MAAFKTLAIAAGTWRVGYVYLEDNKLIDWHVSRSAARSIDAAADHAQEWFDILTPELVVTEAINSKCAKGRNTIALIAAIEQTANDAPVLNATVTKARAYKNKYEEAKALLNQYPELALRSAKKTSNVAKRTTSDDPVRSPLHGATGTASRYRVASLTPLSVGSGVL